MTGGLILATKERADHDRAETGALINDERAARESADTSLSARISAQEGLGGYLHHYDFGAPEPAQDAFTDYAMSQIGAISEPAGIFNGTRVVNDFDGQTWVLTNTPNTTPPVFEWEAAAGSGSSSGLAGVGTNDVAGLIKGSAARLGDVAFYGVNGEARAHGVEEAVASLRRSLLRENFIAPPIDRGIDLFASLAPGAAKWQDGVYCPLNGKIYGIPHNAEEILEIDPETRTATTFGSLGGGADKWLDGAYCPLNGKIYGIPHNAAEVLEIDPIARTATTFGSLSGATKWVGGAYCPETGKVYGIPYSSTAVLEIDPLTQTVTTFGALSGSNKWQGGVYCPLNGKIYGIPHNAEEILEIDPIARTATTFGSLSGASKYVGGVYCPETGKVYGIPNASSAALEIDPETRTATTFGSLGSGAGKWQNGAYCPLNKKVYGIPCNAAAVLEIDPTARTATTFGSLPGDAAKWLGGAYCPETGNIYAIPYSSTAVLEIDFSMFRFPAAVLNAGDTAKFTAPVSVSADVTQVAADPADDAPVGAGLIPANVTFRAVADDTRVTLKQAVLTAGSFVRPAAG